MDEAKRLRAALAEERLAGRGRGRKAYSTELRRRIITYLRRERATGRAVDELIESVGISRPTFYTWVGASRSRGGAKGFRQLAVVPTSATVAPPTVQVGATFNVSDARYRKGPTNVVGITVLGPSGIAVVGMSVADVAELVRRLGC